MSLLIISLTFWHLILFFHRHFMWSFIVMHCVKFIYRSFFYGMLENIWLKEYVEWHMQLCSNRCALWYPVQFCWITNLFIIQNLIIYYFLLQELAWFDDPAHQVGSLTSKLANEAARIKMVDNKFICGISFKSVELFSSQYCLGNKKFKGTICFQIFRLLETHCCSSWQQFLPSSLQ